MFAASPGGGDGEDPAASSELGPRQLGEMNKALDGHDLTSPCIVTEDIVEFAQHIRQEHLVGKPIKGNPATGLPLAELEIDTKLPDPGSTPKVPRLALEGPPEVPPSDGGEPGAKRRPPADKSVSSSGQERPPVHSQPPLLH